MSEGSCQIYCLKRLVRIFLLRNSLIWCISFFLFYFVTQLNRSNLKQWNYKIESSLLWMSCSGTAICPSVTVLRSSFFMSPESGSPRPNRRCSLRRSGIVRCSREWQPSSQHALWDTQSRRWSGSGAFANSSPVNESGQAWS